jgi:hypothetical protein
MSLKAHLLRTVARMGVAAADGIQQDPTAFQPKAKRRKKTSGASKPAEPKCTPCGAMARREVAGGFVQSLTGGGGGDGG